MKKTCKVMGPLEINNITATSDSEMANLFNDHFQSIFTKENEESIIHYRLPESKSIEFPFESFTISKKEIMNIIADLKEDKAPGPDDIHNCVLKAAPESISVALEIIYNRSLMFGEVPEDWKKGNITPVYKKGNKSNPNNYRPISLTSVISKIIERKIREKILHHLDVNNLISASQHGFTKGKSCLTNLIEFFDEIINWDDKSFPIDIMYFDFRKAFDIVPLRKLLIK